MTLVHRVLSVVLLALVLAGNAVAQPDNQTPGATTASDPHIPLGELDIILAPLTIEELTVEADAWLALVKQAAHNVADVKLRIKRFNDALEASNQMPGATAVKADDIKSFQQQKELAVAELTKLRIERTLLIDKLNNVLERMNQKIGLDENGKELPEVLVYRNYINAVGGIKIDTNDLESSIVGIWGWVKSDEGGLRWLHNINLFVLTILGFWVFASILSKLTKFLLGFTHKKSQLFTVFVVGMVHRSVIGVGIIVALSSLEIQVGPLMAVIGAIGFVVAFALQNTISNFASGIMIMMYRPFDVDDFVDIAGVSGKVQSMNLVSTTLSSFDNKRLIIPNNDVWGNIITNASDTNTRRVDLMFGIGYDDDVDKAMQILETLVLEHPQVLKDPAPVVQLHELGDSSVNFIVRPWVKTQDYWGVYWDITRGVKERFDSADISIPFPQTDIHIHHKTAPAALQKQPKPENVVLAHSQDNLQMKRDGTNTSSLDIGHNTLSLHDEDD